MTSDIPEVESTVVYLIVHAEKVRDFRNKIGLQTTGSEDQLPKDAPDSHRKHVR